MRIRSERGISRKELAEQLEIPYTTLRNYETDQREPGHKLLIKMASILSVSVDELIGHHVQNKKIAPSYSDEALKLAVDYDSLDSHGKKIVRIVADEEKARVEASNTKMEAGEIDVDAELAEYGRQLNLQKKAGAGSSASSGSKEKMA